MTLKSFTEPQEKKKRIKQEEEIEKLEAVIKELKGISEEFQRVTGILKDYYTDTFHRIYEANNLDTDILDYGSRPFDIVKDVSLKVSILHDRKYEWRV